MKLRPYQVKAEEDVYREWDDGNRNVLVVLPTGAGKTVVFCDMIEKHIGASCVVAHKQELVMQCSITLARNGIRHRIIGSKAVVKMIVAEHMTTVGKSYFDPNSTCAVASVKTLILRKDALANWLNSVTLLVVDEAHHNLRNNQWGKATAMFKNARVLGVTACTTRADGFGLGKCSDGVFDAVVEGPDMGYMISSGYLVPYRVYAPPSDLDLGAVNVGKGGEFVKKELNAEMDRHPIVGCMVEHYIKLAPGTSAVAFTTDVAQAHVVADKFNASGTPASVISGKMSDGDRSRVLRKFVSKEILVLVNVDILGEGYDCPGIDTVIMGRPTASHQLYKQQFGRALRLLLTKEEAAGWDLKTDAERLRIIASSKKPHGIVIDCVGNVMRHNLPDAYHPCTLDRRDKRSKSKPSDAIPTIVCLKCSAVYARTLKGCPSPTCGHINRPQSRSAPEHVDGDLIELDFDTLAAMRAEVAKVDMTAAQCMADLASRHVPHIGQLAGVKRHIKRQEAQECLRMSIAWWAGMSRQLGREDSESYKRFYFKYGVDVLTAQTLKYEDAISLAEKINTDLGEYYNGTT